MLLGLDRQSEGDFEGAVEALKQMVASHPRARSQLDPAMTGVARGADNGRPSHYRESHHGRPRIFTVKVFPYRNRTATPADSIENTVAWYGSQLAWTKWPPTAAAKESSSYRRRRRQSFGGVATSMTTLPGAVQ
jgi:hypothetical protein